MPVQVGAAAEVHAVLLTVHEVLPGSVMGAIVLEASFQVLPVFVRLADVNVTLRVLGGPAILLLWLYLMANVIVLGAELNWWSARRRAALLTAEEPVALPAQPTERSRPVG